MIRYLAVSKTSIDDTEADRSEKDVASYCS
jgi:hypothetical protein